MSQDFGDDFARHMSVAWPVKSHGVTWGYRVKPRLPKVTRFKSIRASEIQRLAFYRWRYDPPTQEGERRIAIAIAHHAQHHDVARNWIKRWCADLDGDEIDNIIEDATDNPRRWKADELGDFLQVTRQEREHLGITTFRAEGQTKRELTATRKRKARERMQRNRAAERAANPRPISREHEKPWLAEGISRATWHRRRKAALEAVTEDRETTSVRSTGYARGENESSLMTVEGGPKAASRERSKHTVKAAATNPERPNRSRVGSKAVACIGERMAHGCAQAKPVRRAARGGVGQFAKALHILTARSAKSAPIIIAGDDSSHRRASRVRVLPEPPGTMRGIAPQFLSIF